MRLLEAFKRPLSVVDFSSERSSRERLDAAKAARDQAQQAVTAARDRLERLESVVRLSDDAAREASKATQRANQFRNDWVRGGCKHAESRTLQELEDQAAGASKAAERAAVNADLVRKEFSRAQAEIQSLQLDVRTREQEIATEIGAIIADEASPLLERFEQLAEAYRATRVEVRALLRIVRPGQYEDQRAASHEGARLVEAALGRATIHPWDRERDAAQAHDFVEGTRRDEAQLEALMARWRARAEALREAIPDAEF
jgi:predicted  nucleic acid-binding Zn-ribbon protein